MHEARDDGRRVAGPPGRISLAIAAVAVSLALGACGSDLGCDDEGDGESEVEVASTTPVEGEPLTISTAPSSTSTSRRAPSTGPVRRSPTSPRRPGSRSSTWRRSTRTSRTSPSCDPSSRTAPPAAATSSSPPTGWRASTTTSAISRSSTRAPSRTLRRTCCPQLQNPEFDPERKFTVPYQSGMTGLIVRTDLAPDITSINDIFDPKYKGKVDAALRAARHGPAGDEGRGDRPGEATKEHWLATIDKIEDGRSIRARSAT